MQHTLLYVLVYAHIHVQSYVVNQNTTLHDDILTSALPLPLPHSLPPSAQRGGSWVVDRVVGPADWKVSDDSLREQMKRLQLTPLAATGIIHSLALVPLYTIHTPPHTPSF